MQFIQLQIQTKNIQQSKIINLIMNYCGLLIKKIQNFQQIIYSQILQQVTSQDAKIAHIFQEEMYKDHQYYQIQNQIIYFWNQNQQFNIIIWINQILFLIQKQNIKRNLRS
ncbi:hypothetical protein TTHERM_001295314 (macronuclear) [Tetrahymena thermophila SB210]|uniref:Uncharacterized protein n=1 Tax=Tetrahymena thermophila (strain SB210) TaxID=312017 RepID=W7X796_TETTS|nr:hypothetical protein TTHERM_001295314 [Tetrahymena thermophila SB210]EWS73227.1 hypothetical protein TTHERM_001295314 [Tetrahymena thermophila SB210]|eukprot:XP_012654238.1 hypothetical protein TTHERM_001295314 [Tetrahymena thermophila SB210]